MHDSASDGACCQARERRAWESESSRCRERMLDQSFTLPLARCSKSSSASANSASAFFPAFRAFSGTVWPPWSAKTMVMNAIDSVKVPRGPARSTAREPEIWCVAFCMATLMSGSFTPALASLSTVMTSSLLRGSIQKKSVPILVVFLAVSTFAFGKARNCPRSGVFSPIMCQTGCTPSTMQVSRSKFSCEFHASSQLSWSICL